MTIQEAWLKQKELLAGYKINNPEQVASLKARPEAETLKAIGISNLPPNRPKGYIRLFNSDFLVEEKAQSGEIMNLGSDAASLALEPSGRTLYAKLVKIGLTTTIAVDRLKEELKYGGQIGYAGLKDEQAITAQLIALPKFKISGEMPARISLPNLLVSDFFWGKGVIKPGYLKGNVFTITVRTEAAIDRAELELRLGNLEKFGFLNYFQSQRFGGVRLKSHLIGQLVLQENYQAAVKELLCAASDYELPLIAGFKKSAEKLFPDFAGLKKVFEQLPYSFYQELILVEYLINHPDDFIGALSQIKDNLTICLYAYASWLFNRQLSDYSRRRGVVAERFPLLMSSDPADQKFYRPYLDRDGIKDIYSALKPFKFIYWTKRDWAGRIFPEQPKSKIFPGGAVINFFLPKGAYATTFLANLFELHEEAPAPAWVKNNEIDAKELLGQGSLRDLKIIFKDCWHEKKDLI